MEPSPKLRAIGKATTEKARQQDVLCNGGRSVMELTNQFLNFWTEGLLHETEPVPHAAKEAKNQGLDGSCALWFVS